MDNAHFTISNDEYNYTLVIKDCALNDGASYKMVVDQVSTQATLTVNGKSGYECGLSILYLSKLCCGILNFSLR